MRIDHPGGYRQLELEVRQGIREVEDTLLAAPEDLRPPLEIVRRDLIETDDALIRLLFPRRTQGSGESALRRHEAKP